MNYPIIFHRVQKTPSNQPVLLPKTWKAPLGCSTSWNKMEENMKNQSSIEDTVEVLNIIIYPHIHLG